MPKTMEENLPWYLDIAKQYNIYDPDPMASLGFHMTSGGFLDSTKSTTGEKPPPIEFDPVDGGKAEVAVLYSFAKRNDLVWLTEALDIIMNGDTSALLKNGSGPKVKERLSNATMAEHLDYFCDECHILEEMTPDLFP